MALSGRRKRVLLSGNCSFVHMIRGILMFCTSCGRQIEDNAAFCPYCGAKVLASIDDSETGLSVGPDFNSGGAGKDDSSWDESVPYGGSGGKGGSGYSDGGYSGGSGYGGSGYSGGSGGSGYNNSGYSNGSGGNGYNNSGYSNGSGGNGYSSSGYSNGSGGNGYGNSGYSGGSGSYGGSGYNSGSGGGYDGAGYGSSGYGSGSGSYGGSGYSDGSGYGGSGYGSGPDFGSGSGYGGGSGFGGSGGPDFGGGPDLGSDRSFEKRTEPAKLRGSGTVERMIHLGSGLVGFSPLLGVVFSLLFGLLMRVIMAFFWRSAIFSAISLVRQIVFVACLVLVIGVLVGSVYLVLSGKIEQTQEFIFVLIASFIAVIYFALLIVHQVLPVRIILILADLVLGIDLVAKLVTYGTGLYGSFNLQESLNVLRSRSVERQARSGKGNAGPGGAGNATSYGAAAGAAAYGTLSTAVDGRAGGNGPQGYGSQGYGPQGYGPQGGSPYPGMNMGESYFDGTGAELLGNLILTVLVSTLTCGIATPWFLCRIYKWRKEHTVIDGKRLTFNGTGAELLGKWIIWELLTLITCGLYSLYVVIALKKWELSHTAYMGGPEIGEAVYPGSLFDGSFASYLGNSILCSFLTMITCGIAYPWASVPLLKWEYNGSVVSGDRAGYFGKGTDMFGIYIINGLLSCITCGIYTPWAICRVNRYVYSNVHIVRRG